MKKTGFWEMMNRGLKFDNRPTQVRVNKIADHQFKDSIGGDSSNYNDNIDVIKKGKNFDKWA